LEELPALERVSDHEILLQIIKDPDNQVNDQKTDQDNQVKDENENDKFFNEIIQLYETRGIKWEPTGIYRQIFKSCGHCGKMVCRENVDLPVSLDKRIKLLKNMFDRKIIPENIDGQNLYMWVVEKINKWSDYDRFKILEIMNTVFSDRSKFYQERDTHECSILEEVLRNGDIEQLQDSTTTNKFAFHRKCKMHKCTPIGGWLLELTEVKDLDQFRNMLLAYGKASKGTLHYYANDVNWWRLPLLTGRTKRSVEIFNIMLKLGFPLPRMIKNNVVINSSNRTSIIEGFIGARDIYLHQLKDTMLFQLKENAKSEKLIINELELIDMDPVEEIDALEFLVLSNGVAWNINNFIDYIMYTTKGKNEYDDKTKIAELAGKPIWCDNDLLFLKYFRDHAEGSLRRKIDGLINYINSAQYRKYFTEEEIEELRRFTSVFASRGAWWDNELKKVVSKKEWEEWESRKKHMTNTSLPSTSQDLNQIIFTLKARYLLFYKEFYANLTPEKNKALRSLNHQLSDDYQKSVIQGVNCIMTFSSNLKAVIEKLGLTIEEMNEKLVKNLDVVDTRTNDEIDITKLDPVKDADLIILRFPSRLEGRHVVEK
jgi:hypothetical protein